MPKHGVVWLLDVRKVLLTISLSWQKVVVWRV